MKAKRKTKKVEEREREKKMKKGGDLLHRRTLVTGPIFSRSVTRGGILPPAGVGGERGAGRD